MSLLGRPIIGEFSNCQRKEKKDKKEARSSLFFTQTHYPKVLNLNYVAHLYDL